MNVGWTAGYLIGTTLAGLVIAVPSALVIGFGYYLFRRPRLSMRTALSNRWVLLSGAAVGLIFLVVRAASGAFRLP
jgi:hypothetical protein